MNWLFVHRFFPSQFVHIAHHLAARGDNVVFITHHDGQIAAFENSPGSAASFTAQLNRNRARTSILFD